MNENNLYDYHKHNLVYISDYIKFADTKAGIFLTINVAIIGFLLKSYKKIHFPLKYVSENINFLLINVALILLLCSVYQFGNIIFPRYPKDKQYYMSWGGMASFDKDEYVNKINNTDTTQFLKDMAVQNHDLSIVCINKYARLKKGIWCFVSGSILSGIYFLLNK